jgi:hypothetical protein
VQHRRIVLLVLPGAVLRAQPAGRGARARIKVIE